MTRNLFEYPNVVGYGKGLKVQAGRRTSKVAQVVLVTRKVEAQALAAGDLIPAEHDGLRTDVVEVGVLRALLARTDRWRPAPGGVSIGHRDITAGTLGCLVKDAATGHTLILSNNHVLANSNDAAAGDPILQPGPYDGGDASDTIAYLERWAPIVFLEGPGTCPVAQGAAWLANVAARLAGSGHRLRAVQARAATNLFDAAVARPVSDGLVEANILELRQPVGLAAPIELMTELRKSGRTTGLSVGHATVVDATVDVSYGAGRTARFEGQVVSNMLCQGGDSGSVVLDAADRLAALLFAGSDQATIVSPIGPVLASLGLTL